MIDDDLPGKKHFIQALIKQLREFNVTVLGDEKVSNVERVTPVENDQIWFKEFLDYKIVLGIVSSSEDAISMINKYGGGHSAVIITKNSEEAELFMESVDSAAVYQNASTRFTDGGQFGLGGELAISTDKIHHRGPMGLQHLITNKWYVFGDGQIR